MDLSRRLIIRFVGCLGLLLSGLTTLSFGQDISSKSLVKTEIRRDTVVRESVDKHQVVTNRFWDNWFIGVGAGVQMYFSDHDRQMDVNDRLSPAFDFYFGKWFSPDIGVRAAFSGFKINALTQNGSYSTGEIYDSPMRLMRQEFNYFNSRADVLFNMNNILSGYKETRFYTISPYLGLGWMQTVKKPRGKDLSANIGLFNGFRLSQSIDFTIDVRGSMVSDRFDGELGKRHHEGLLITTAGLVYKFKKRGWERPKITTIRYDEAALVALSDQVTALKLENERLGNLLNDSKTGGVTKVNVQNRVLVAPNLVTFQINQIVVSEEARVNLGFFAKVINENKSNVRYKITGYADKGTGKPNTNQRLSKQRAEAVYRVLVKEFGVSPAQLEISYQGGTDNMFYNDPRLTRAVITIANQ